MSTNCPVCDYPFPDHDQLCVHYGVRRILEDPPAPDPLDDDRDQENPCEYSEGYDFSNHDFDNDPDWR